MGTDGAFMEKSGPRNGHVVAVDMRTDGLQYAPVVAIDLEGFSKLRAREQRAAQTSLAAVLNQAAAATGLVREDWYRQPRGDGELAVLPLDTDVAWVVANFTDQLVVALHRLRLDSSGQPILRLRVAMHHGPLTGGEFGPVGSAPIVTARLLDARRTKAALAADPDSDLVLVVSRQLYDDVVVSGFHGLVSERFQPMRATIKGATYAGYLCLGSPK